MNGLATVTVARDGHPDWTFQTYTPNVGQALCFAISQLINDIDPIPTE